MEKDKSSEIDEKPLEDKAEKDSKDSPKKGQKVSLADFKMKSFVTSVKVDQMQFLKTAGG